MMFCLLAALGYEMKLILRQESIISFNSPSSLGFTKTGFLALGRIDSVWVMFSENVYYFQLYQPRYRCGLGS